MLRKKQEKVNETIIIVGPYRIPVSRESFKAWEADLMAEAGFTEKEIRTEILRRLGYEHY